MSRSQPPQKNPGNTSAPQQQMILQQHVRSGPLPDPQELQLYEQLVPGAAARIIRMGELQQEHRHKLEQSEADKNLLVAKENADYGKRGQWMAYTITVAAFAIGTFMAMNNQGAFATVLFGTVLLGLVSSFIAGRTGNQKPP